MLNRDERVLPDQWSILVSEWSSENGSNIRVSLPQKKLNRAQQKPVNEETAAVIEASSGDCKVLHWEFYMGFLPVVIFQFEKMWILLLSKFSMKAYANSFYFDFTMTYIRAGMICSHLVNSSLLARALLSYEVMCPLIGSSNIYLVMLLETFPLCSVLKAISHRVFGQLKHMHQSFHFDCAYIRDGLYNFLKITFFTARNIYTTSRRKPKLNPDDNNAPQDNLQRDEVFLRESIPFWVAATGYVMFSIVSIIEFLCLLHMENGKVGYQALLQLNIVCTCDSNSAIKYVPVVLLSQATIIATFGAAFNVAEEIIVSPIEVDMDIQKAREKYTK
ncbi:metal-nicotianamine transporter YSL3-like protein [Tanacetum coccineum]